MIVEYFQLRLEEFEILIASSQERERVVAEIFYENVQWEEISQETEDELIVQFYPHTNQEYWEFELEEAIQAPEKARNKLLEL